MHFVSGSFQQGDDKPPKHLTFSLELNSENEFTPIATGINFMQLSSLDTYKLII
jgi:hypothetical protein